MIGLQAFYKYSQILNLINISKNNNVFGSFARKYNKNQSFLF